MSVASNEGQVQGDDSIRAETKDGQEVIIDASVIYQLDPNQVVPFHTNLAKTLRGWACTSRS